MHTLFMKFLKSKKILITGGAGFIGSHIVNQLIQKGHHVAVIDNLSSGKKESIHPKATFYNKDIRDKNISRILETIVVVSSDKAYGKSKKLPYQEHFPLKGDHPYDVSKSAADLIAQTYFSTYNLPIAITRFSNVYGPGDLNFSRIVPGAIDAVINNKELLIRSDGKMVRGYTYVKDIADGCIKLMENKEKVAGQAFNFACENIFSVMDVVKKIEKILEAKINYKILNIANNEIPKQYLDWTKARKILNWQPMTTFEEGIKETFEWIKNNKNTT